MQRELVKWVQSLDLSYPVKNPRRDLCNGFTVAEIISRYNKDIAMHSIDTGLAMTRRVDNWAQIKKVLDKVGCTSITPSMIEGTMGGKDADVSIRLLETLYAFLTRKQLRPNVMSNMKDELQLPGYQRSTAAKVLRDCNDRTSEKVAELNGHRDEMKIHQTNMQRLNEHRVKLQTMKIAAPERYAPKVRLDGTATAHSASGVREAPAARAKQKMQITREVDVHTLDDDLVSTFAQRDAQEREEAFRSGFDLTQDLSHNLGRVCARPLTSFGLLGELDAATNASQGDYFTKFVFLRRRLSPEVNHMVWNALHEAVANIAKMVVYRPSEATHLVIGMGFLFSKETALLSGIESNLEKDMVHSRFGEESGDMLDIHHALALLREIGAQCLRVNPEAAVTVCSNYIVPAASVSLTLGTPSTMAAMCALFTAFLNTNHLDSVRGLLTVVRDTALGPNPSVADRFYRCVYHIFTQIDISLCYGADALVQYHATAALAMCSSTPRISGLLLLQLLAQSHPMAVTPLLPMVIAAGNDPLWEVRANQLVLLCTIHRHCALAVQKTPATEEDEQMVQLVEVLRGAIAATFQSFDGAPLLQRKLAMRAVAPFSYPSLNAGLCEMLVDRIVALNDETRHTLLRPDAFDSSAPVVEALVGRVRGFYVVGGLYEVWNARAMAESISTFRTKYSTFDALSLLEPVVLSQRLDAEREEWLALLPSLKGDITDPIYNPAACRAVADKDMPTCVELAYSVAAKFYADLSGDSIEEGVSLEELQERAIEWLQTNV